MKGGMGLALVAGLGALMFAGGGGGGGSQPAPKPPRGRPSEETPPEITGRMAAAMSTMDPTKIRAEAAKLRKEGWDREATELEGAASKIERGNTTPGPDEEPRALSEGMQGEDVREWQRQLAKDGYKNVAADAIFGPITVSATKSWQTERGLKSDGIVGPATRAAIGSKPSVKPPAPTTPTKPPTTPAPVKPPASTGPRVLSQGMSGDDVKAWQRQLIADGYTHLAADGKYGPLTTEATKIWQAERGLKPDGIVGPATRAAIGSSPIASVPGAPGTTGPIASTPAPKPLPGAPAPVLPPAPKPPTPAAAGPMVNTAPAPSSGDRLLKRGVQGEDVRAWQTQLVKDGFVVTVDGVFGEKTEAATLAWQRSRGLSADGIVGPKTRAAIGKPAAAPAGAAHPPLTVDTSKWRTLKEGMTGNDVKEWQLVLNKYGSIVVATDGVFGPKTTVATKAFQAEHGLTPVDGIVGKGTRAKLDQIAGVSIVAGELEAAPADIYQPPPFVLGPEETEPPSSSASSSPEQLAQELVDHLEGVSVGQEDRELVRRFQRVQGLNDTGIYGPGTAEAIASLGIVPPRPFDWPSKKTFRVKARYKAAMHEYARRDPARAAAWATASNV